MIIDLIIKYNYVNIKYYKIIIIKRFKIISFDLQKMLKRNAKIKKIRGYRIIIKLDFYYSNRQSLRNLMYIYATALDKISNQNTKTGL